MELIKENIKVNDSVFCSPLRKMIEGDMIVPDTKPDILKVLQADAVSRISECEVTDGALIIRGRVDITVLYIPDSERSSVTSMSASFEFEEEAADKGIKPEDTAFVNSAVERAEFSLINSRKLRIKSVVGFESEVLRQKQIELAVDAGEEIEIKRSTVTLRSSAGNADFAFLVRGRLSVPAGRGAFGDILKLDYCIRDTEYKAITGRVTVKGCIGVCVLYTDKDGSIEFCESELPFTEVWEMDDVTEDCDCDIEYRIDDCGFSVEEDTDGDLREAAVTASVTALVKATEAIEADIIDDCYMPYRKTKLTREKITLEESAACPSSQSTVREIIDLPEGSPEISSVYNVIAVPHIAKASIEGHRLLCEGRIEACVLYVSDSAENPVYSIKKNIPFSVSMDCGTSGGGAVPKLKAEIKHTGYNLNSSGDAEVRCILSINADIVRKRELELITAAETSAGEDKGESRIVIYFVQNGDTLWEIAKRYGVPGGAICAMNELPDDNIKQGMRLIIPGK